MTTDEAIEFFTKPVLYKLLGCKTPRQTVSAWGEYPPPLRQFQLQVLSGGKLKVEPGLVQRMPAQSQAHDAPPVLEDPNSPTLH